MATSRQAEPKRKCSDSEEPVSAAEDAVAAKIAKARLRFPSCPVLPSFGRYAKVTPQMSSRAPTVALSFLSIGSHSVMQVVPEPAATSLITPISSRSKFRSRR